MVPQNRMSIGHTWTESPCHQMNNASVRHRGLRREKGKVKGSCRVILGGVESLVGDYEAEMLLIL